MCTRASHVGPLRRPPRHTRCSPPAPAAHLTSARSPEPPSSSPSPRRRDGTTLPDGSFACEATRQVRHHGAIISGKVAKSSPSDVDSSPCPHHRSKTRAPSTQAHRRAPVSCSEIQRDGAMLVDCDPAGRLVVVHDGPAAGRRAGTGCLQPRRSGGPRRPQSAQVAAPPHPTCRIHAGMHVNTCIPCFFGPQIEYT